MRAAVVLVALLMIPSVVGEFGDEVNGYPVGENGLLHDPAVAFEPGYLEFLADKYGFEPPLNRAGPATVYPYYPILTAEIQRLVTEHPDKVRLQTGTSTLGLDIHFLEIANFADEGSADFIPLEEREVVMLDGGTHSNEYSGVYFVLAIAQWLLDESPNDGFAQWILENRFTVITPLINPDGSHAMGRLNANTVNINRNFPVLWGGDGTDMLLNNPGPSPASEIETQLVVDRVVKYQPDYHGSIHCCGNLWLFPYGEDGYDPLDVDMMNRICDVAYPPEIADACGPIWSTIYPASGSTVDTVYEYTGAVAFGFEMSGRSNLAGPWGEPVTTMEVAMQEQESWGGVMHAFQNVHLYGGYPEVRAVVTDGDSIQMTVANVGYGPLNATVSIGAASASFEMLGAGNVTTILLQGVPEEADEVVVDYQKRIMVGPRGTLRLPIEAVDGTLAVGGVVAETSELLQSTDDQQAPGAGILGVIALAGLAVALRRR